LDEARKAQQQESQAQAAKQAELTARLEALRALQEKVQTEGKLKPWLAKHGLDSLQGLWRKVHIEPGWEIALESALRERLSALEVGRVETVRAFEHDAPPAKLAFYSLPQAGIQNTHHHAAPLVRSVALAGRKPEGADERLAGGGLYRRQPGRGTGEPATPDARRGHHDPAGHTVSQFAVSFYAPDSEQAACWPVPRKSKAWTSR
jgi:chromosome segregation protein